ncbi:hypothetical protein BZZ73_004063 [Salmonella enterica subsp. enterica serovar Saintpaul]|nr:hypothetical protein [Salmonella enterica subsp. enterica serovar Saintpaul]
MLFSRKFTQKKTSSNLLTTLTMRLASYVNSFRYYDARPVTYLSHVWSRNKSIYVIIRAINKRWPDKNITIHDVLWFLPFGRLLFLQRLVPDFDELNDYLFSLSGHSNLKTGSFIYRKAEKKHIRYTGTDVLFTINNELMEFNNVPFDLQRFIRDISAYIQEPYRDIKIKLYCDIKNTACARNCTDNYCIKDAHITV